MRVPHTIKTYFAGAVTIFGLIALLQVGRRTFRPTAGSHSEVHVVRNARISAEWSEISTGYRIDSGTSPVQLVVFTNYECPFCRTGDQALRGLLAETNDIGVVIRPIGSPSYPASEAAAVAAECAGDQGRFTEMNEALFASTGWRISGDFTEEAASAGVQDLEGFSACMSSDDALHSVQENRRLAVELGFTGTPAYAFATGAMGAGLSPDDMKRELGL